VVADAMGLALSNAAGTQQALVEKTVAKRLQSALAARAGVFCAQLACAGASAPRQALEGTYGYFTKYEDCDPAVLLADLGSVFEGTKSAIKKYPSCTANHAPLDAAITLAEEFDIDAGAVEEVEVTLSPFSARLVAGPFEPTSNPQVAAQFSIQCSMASALLRRRLAIADIQDAAVLHPAAGTLAKRVRVVVDESSRGKFAPSRVVIVTKRCGRLERAVSLVPGTPENPLSSRDFRAKLVDCFGSGPQPMSLTAVAHDGPSRRARRYEEHGAIFRRRRGATGSPKPKSAAANSDRRQVRGDNHRSPRGRDRRRGDRLRHVEADG